MSEVSVCHEDLENRVPKMLPKSYHAFGGVTRISFVFIFSPKFCLTVFTNLNDIRILVCLRFKFDSLNYSYVKELSKPAVNLTTRDIHDSFLLLSTKFNLRDDPLPSANVV